MTNITDGKITIFHGKIHYKYGLFSIAMLDYQRVAVLVVNMNFKTFLDLRGAPRFGKKHSGRPW